MTQYDDELKGVLFKNDTKEGRQPDYRGEATIHGTKYALSAWIRDSKTGRKYLSLAFSGSGATVGETRPRRSPGGRSHG